MGNNGRPDYEDTEVSSDQQGMALRDYFAGQVLPAVIAAYVQGNGGCIGTDHILRNAVTIAFKFADAMLAEREKD
jgi:hypothetical protein